MNAVEVVRRLHAHRMWVNSKLISAAETLTDDQLKQGFAVGQGSLWKTLLHLYAAEYVWLEALSGNEQPLTPGDLPNKIPGNQAGDGAMTSLSELRQRWAELDKRWEAYLAGLTESAFDEQVYKVRTGFGDPQRHGTPRSDVLLHVCTHAQYTVAQAVNMLRQLGVKKLPDVMLITLSREEGR